MLMADKQATQIEDLEIVLPKIDELNAENAGTFPIFNIIIIDIL